MNYYPRVLLVNGEPLGTQSATGITLSNLFRGWPQDRIVQIFTANIVPDHRFCSNHIKLSKRDISLLGGYLGSGEGARLDLDVKTTSWLKSEVKALTAKRARVLLTPLIDLFPYKLTESLLAQIAEFRPEVIYSTLGNIRLLRVVRSLSDTFAIPVVPHFMDDWLSTYSSRGRSLITTLQRKLANKLCGEIIARAPGGMAIGDLMASEYTDRFGIPFTAFMNPVDITNGASERSPLRQGETRTVRFVYVGGLHLGRVVNVIEIAKAVRRLQSNGVNIEFSVYSSRHDLDAHREKILSTGGVARCDTLNFDQVQRVLQESHVAIHVESFEESMIQYTRLSVSTKIPQYFAAGLPVLAFGPATIASCRYVVDNNCGLGVDSMRADVLDAALAELAENQVLRLRMAENALDTARIRHNAAAERERFRSFIGTAATTGMIGGRSVYKSD